MFQVSPDYSRMAPTERLSPERRRSLKTMFPDEARSAELKESSGICDYIVRKTNLAVHLLPVYNRTD